MKKRSSTVSGRAGAKSAPSGSTLVSPRKTSEDTRFDPSREYKYPPQTRRAAKCAANDLRKYGWIQGSLNYGKPGVPCCAQGAMVRVTKGAGSKGFTALHRAFRSEIGVDMVTAWNDRPERTKEEVLDVFDSISLATAIAGGTPQRDSARSKAGKRGSSSSRKSPKTNPRSSK